MPPDRRVGDPAEVVVEQLAPPHATGPRPVEDGVILEQVLAPVDRPHLAAVKRHDEILGDRHESTRRPPRSQPATQARVGPRTIRFAPHGHGRSAPGPPPRSRASSQRAPRRAAPAVRSRATTTAPKRVIPARSPRAASATRRTRSPPPAQPTPRRRSPSSASSHSARAQANPRAIARSTDAVRRRAASRPS